MLLRRLVFPVVVLVSALVAVPAYAGGHQTTSTSRASVSASPNPVASGGSSYTLSGCGYVLGKSVNVVVNEPKAMLFTSVGTDSSGCMRLMLWTGDAPATYAISTYQQLRGGTKQTLMASTSLQVT